LAEAHAVHDSRVDPVGVVAATVLRPLKRLPEFVQRLAQKAGVNNYCCHVAHYEHNRALDYDSRASARFGEDAVVKQEDGDPNQTRSNGVQETGRNVILGLMVKV
jgi:hypothetical protein